MYINDCIVRDFNETNYLQLLKYYKTISYPLLNVNFIRQIEIKKKQKQKCILKCMTSGQSGKFKHNYYKEFFLLNGLTLNF